MLPSEKDAVNIWLSLIEAMPSSVMSTLRKIKGGTATVVTCERSVTREPFTAGMCFNADKLTTYLLHEFGCSVNELPAQSPDDISLLNLGMRLEQMLHSHANVEEAPGLYSVLMEGPIPKGLRRNEEKPRRYSTERYVEHIWRALIILDWSRALQLMESIYAGTAYLNVRGGSPDRVPFHRSDLYEDGKLEYLLSTMPDPVNIEELVKRVPPGEAGDFHREFVAFIYQHCAHPKDQGERLYEMFFGKPIPVEIEMSRLPMDHSALVEMIPPSLSKVYSDFLVCGQQLGIPITTLSILLPSETRNKLRIDILNNLIRSDQGATDNVTP
jgi:hypothetical protein